MTATAGRPEVGKRYAWICRPLPSESGDMSRKLIMLTVDRVEWNRVRYNVAGKRASTTITRWDIEARAGRLRAAPSHDPRPTDPLATAAEAKAA